jgi:MFS family permease
LVNLASTSTLICPGAAYTSHILGAVNALFFFGACVGALAGGLPADKIGRKWALLSQRIQVSLEVLMHVAMLIVVRILHGSGFGALATLVPICLAEALTPSKPGILTGLHGFWMLM